MSSQIESIEELKRVAYRILAELVCCEAYSEEGCTAPGHEMCHWGEASARVVEQRISELEQGVCCQYHLPEGCCDAEDCGPCCPDCPTCPTIQRARAARKPVKE